MALKGKVDPNAINYKARLEKKLYLAQESPEPVFDISDCNLKALPTNIFALCKALRKDTVYLNNNNLVNLASGGSLADLKYVKLLNLSANKLTKLPNNLHGLENLEVLDISMNQLTELPESIGSLQKLVLLNASHNSLSAIPDSIGLCKSLESVDFTWNENLKRLPTAMCKLTALRQLNIDSTVTFPPRDVYNRGMKEILKFLTREYKEEALAAANVPEVVKPSVERRGERDELQEQFAQHEKLQQEKQQDRIRVEKDLMDQRQKEIELQQKGKEDKKKLVESVKKEQDAQDADILKIQEKKKAEFAALIRQCKEEEKRASDIVGRILKLKKHLQLQFTKEWENERKSEEEVLYRYAAETRAMDKKKILASMEEVMRDEILQMQKITTDNRYRALSTLASGISQENKTVENLLAKKNEDRKNLIDSLRLDEELQKSAVASLLEKSDIASWELAQEVAIVEEELAEITAIEISRKKLEADARVNELNKNRLALTDLLTNLMERQAQRRNQLIDSIRRMEALKESVKDVELFWMQQFEKVMNSKNLEMIHFLESLDFALVTQFYLQGVFHLLPLLRDIISPEEKLDEVREVNLIEAGIRSGDDRAKILRAVRAFLEFRENFVGNPPPLLTDDVALAPKTMKSSRSFHTRVESGQRISVHPSSSVRSRMVNYCHTTYFSVDCVICLEAKPAVIFLPCGHVCCCFNCLNSVTACPLCRSPIESVQKKAEQLF